MGQELVGKIVVLNDEFKAKCIKEESGNEKYYGQLGEVIAYNGEASNEYLREYPYQVMLLNNTETHLGLREGEFKVIPENDPILLYEVGQDYDYLFHKTKITKIDYVYHMKEIQFENGVREVIEVPQFSPKRTIRPKFHKIALIGEAGSGKDYIAQYLMENYDYARLAFADKVKSIAAELFPTYSFDNKPRELLQALGTKMREIDPKVWIRPIIKEVVADSRFFVVTDLRLPNEYEALKEQGFTFIRILTSEETRMKRLNARGDVFKETDLKHHTEKHYDTFVADFFLSNNDTNNVKAQIDGLLTQ